jgi:hypothetical protein
MHIYNWYLSNTTGIHYVHEHRLRVRNNPLTSCFSPFPFAPHSYPLYLLGTLLAVIGSVHIVSRLLVNWSSHFPPLVHIPPIPKSPLVSPDQNIHSLGRHREPGSQDRAQYIHLVDSADQIPEGFMFFFLVDFLAGTAGQGTRMCSGEVGWKSPQTIETFTSEKWRAWKWRHAACVPFFV